MNKLLKIVTVVFLACLCHSVYAEVERVKIVVTNNKKALLPNVSIQEMATRKVAGMTDNNGEAVIEVFVGKK